MRVDKRTRASRLAVLGLFGATVAFLALNLAMDYAPTLAAPFRSGNPVARKYGETVLLKVYPGKDRSEIESLLRETWSRPLEYEAYTQFKERAYEGRHVNVEAHGFRVSAQEAKWPPRSSDVNVFVFGGSTTFGYGVADSNTIPSYLEEEVQGRLGAPVAVFNFGRAFYYSTQERVLFEQLILSGYIPDVAIFIDGLNDFSFPSDEPQYTRVLKESLASVSSTQTLVALSKLPALQSMKKLIRRLRGLPGEERPRPVAGERSAIVQRYLSNKRIIEAVAGGFGVKTVFVWQPVPFYKYDRASNPFAEAEDMPGVVEGYRMMAGERSGGRLGDNFVWCADIQESQHKPLYVDRVHYTAALSKDLAACIAQHMQARNLLATRLGTRGGSGQR